MASTPAPRVPPFAVEQWMDKYETTPGVLNIAETCSSSISLGQLVALDPEAKGQSEPPSLMDYSRPMTYGHIRGSPELRASIADLYNENAAASSSTGDSPSSTNKEVVTGDGVLVTPGAIAANHLVFYSLLQPDDHVVCVYPTYQQLYTIPATLGCSVSLWRLRAEDGFVPSLSELEGLVRPGKTRMIVVNNPNNPTGVPIPRAVLEGVVAVARRHDIIVFSDEVYSPLFHSIDDSSSASSSAPGPPPPTALSLGYPRVVATGSMSKAWALAGIRLGWLASPDPSIVEAAARARDYTTISVSMLDDRVASYALSRPVRRNLLARNTSLARANLALLAEFVDRWAARGVCDWVRPQAGTTAFVRFLSRRGRGGENESENYEPVDDEKMAVDVLQRTGAMMVPGSRCFSSDGKQDFRGYQRIGYVCETETLRTALGRLDKYVEEFLA